MTVQSSLKVSLRRNVELKSYTTMQVGGQANYFAEPTHREELLEAIHFAQSRKLPWVILGKGSNVIFPDAGYEGVVISFLQFEKKRIEFDLSNLTVTAGAGVYLYALTLACREQGLGGIEFLASIPGTLGGAVFMNAGYSRVSGQTNEIGDWIEKVTVFDETEGFKTLDKKDLQFSYRSSNIGRRVVVDAQLKLKKSNIEAVEKEIRACFDYRNQKQDMKRPSCGSTFKNPPSPAPAAAKLIDELGLKGERVGGIQVSEQHANYFVKVGDATCEDVKMLVKKIQEKVFNETGIMLEPEIRFMPQN